MMVNTEGVENSLYIELESGTGTKRRGPGGLAPHNLHKYNRGYENELYLYESY
jgi:hypothetical protein